MDTADRGRNRLSRFYRWRYAGVAIVLGCYAGPLFWLVAGSAGVALGLTPLSMRTVALDSAKCAALIFLCQLVVAFSAGLLWLWERLLRRPPDGPISN